MAGKTQAPRQRNTRIDEAIAHGPLALALAPCAPAQAAEVLRLEAKIPLGQVVGRIDHMAFDPARKRLFVAELGNDSVGVVDVEARQVVHRIAGLHHPQGVGYLTSHR